MNMLGDFISQDPNHNFLHYLNHENYGSKHNLTHQLIDLEKQWDIPCGSLYTFTKMYENRVWEIPTNELCEGLIRLFRKLNITCINELASGNGLLSARLKFYSKKLNYKLDVNTSDGTNKMFGNHPFTYTTVEDLNIKKFNKSEPIIISWIHSIFEDELLSVVEMYKNDYIFLIGQCPDKENYGNNHSYKFHKKTSSYGYNCMIFEFKQISQMDYYLDDDIRTDIYNENKTCVTLYYKKSKTFGVNYASNSLKKNHPKLFGKYLHENKEYYNQDKKLIDISNKKIQEYSLNDFKDVNPLYAKGLRTYMSIKSGQQIRNSSLISRNALFKNNFLSIPIIEPIFEPFWRIQPIKQIRGRILRNIDYSDNILIKPIKLNSYLNYSLQSKKYVNIPIHGSIIIFNPEYKNHISMKNQNYIDKPFGPTLIKILFLEHRKFMLDQKRSVNEN
ncbi:hypothetical protein QLL95_gp0013 [Cotonvirus japonicus]|uniref:Methyltransferase n=1 Tax=Cotonvirus japonicus TaxID=2811091 RepID=A0ABM7NQR8_9VIRU|nr:hypothetical protein QLL95_gp0013 [Cotonvirus japonicus]BCS82502.1 hypothetical protein [Cotonvirus japonicus]